MKKRTLHTEGPSLQLPPAPTVEDMVTLPRGVHTMGALGKGGEYVLWAVASTGRRLREVLVESEDALPTEILHLWDVLDRVDPVNVPMRMKLRAI